MKIRYRLLIISLAITLIPIVAISAFSITRSQKVIKESVKRDLKHLAKEKANSIALIFENRIVEAKTLAASRELKEALRTANRRYRGMTDSEIRGSINSIDEEWISTKRRSAMADSILNSDLSRYLEEYQQIDPEQSGELFVTDRLGATVAMTNRLSDYYQADEEWWQRGFDGGRGRVVIDDRGYDESVEALTVGVIVPVRDDGEVIGVLKINNKIRKVMEIIQTLAFGGEEHILLARSQGSVLASSMGWTVEKIPGITPVEAAVMRKGDTEGWSEDEHGGKRRIEGYSSVDMDIILRVSAEGERRGISGEKWVPTRWFVFVELDEAVAFAGISSFKKALLIFCFLTGFVVVVLTVLSARSISNPIHTLTKGVEGIRRGRFGGFKVGTDSKDEVGQLSRAFDSMCEDLEKVTASRDILDREITERKRAEEELRASEKKLREAQKMEVVGSLTAGMAHEVRNPLNSLMALTEALFVVIGDNIDAQPYLKHIQAQVDRLSVLMKDLLSLGKPVDVSGLERLDLYDICTAAVGLCLHPVKGDAAGCKCRLIKAPGVDNIQVACDGERLKQALLNLLENAANHSPDGSEVRLIIEEPVNGMCIVKVHDLGAGIPEKNIPRLFEPFFTTRRGGTGLGLSLVKNIIESIGGTVEISNNDPPPGCSVEITLPLAKGE